MDPKVASTPESAPAPSDTTPELDTTPPQDAAAGDSSAPAASGEKSSEDTGPKTMLEAISEGLDKGRKADAEGDEAAAPEQTPEAKVAAEKKAAEKKAKPEGEQDDDFTPPEGLTPRSEGRFKKLVDRAKQAESEAAEFKERWSALESVFRDNGIQQDQFESAVGYIGAINRGDIAAAKQMLEQELQALTLLTGEEFAPRDPLAGFDDLKQAVDNLEMPRARALELARYRMQNGVAQHEMQQQNQLQQQAQQWETQKGEAIRSIDAFVKEREANDLDWMVKGPIMQANVLKWCEGLPPQQWPAQIKRMYEAIGMGARQSPAAGNGNTPRPLRGAGMGAGAKPQPRNMAEAMWGAGIGNG